MLNFIYVLSFLSFALFLVKWIFTYSSPQISLPPSPPKIPILGNLHQLGLYPHRSLQTLAQRHGPLMLLHFGKTPVVIVSSADAAREIMKTHDLIFSNRPKLSMADRLLYGGNDVSAAPYGEYWRQMRSICVLQVLSNKRVQSFEKIREEEVSFLIKKIEDSAKQPSPVNLSEILYSLTNDVICRAAFGKKYNDSEGEGGRKFKNLLAEFTELLGAVNIGDFIPWLSWINLVNGVDARVDKVAKDFDMFLDQVVEEHLNRETVAGDATVEKEGGSDLVDVLLEIQKDSPITRVSIKALILDMFAAGTDTTSTVLEWAMTELLRHPRVLKELQNEMRQITNGKPYVESEDLDKMIYMKAVFKEVFRLYPPIPLLVPRESIQDVNVNGYDISAGTMVFTNAWAIGRDPKIWDKPEEFIPERFLNNSIDFKGHDFELIPFGAGRRGCPGVVFAMTLNEIALANIVYRFDWSLPGGAKPEDLDMTECVGLTIHRKAPLFAVASPSTY